MCNLVPKIFVMIFVIQFMRDIGLKLLTNVGVLILGTRVINSLLRGCMSTIPL
jgi:hypothetical protein